MLKLWLFLLYLIYTCMPIPPYLCFWFFWCLVIDTTIWWSFSLFPNAVSLFLWRSWTILIFYTHIWNQSELSFWFHLIFSYPICRFAKVFYLLKESSTYVSLIHAGWLCSSKFWTWNCCERSWCFCMGDCTGKSH